MSFFPFSQVQQKLNELKEEERSVTAQLSWKRALEDSSPVMVNGSSGSSGDHHQGDPFQQDLFQEDKPRELKEDGLAAVSNELLENPTQTEKVVNESQEEEEKEEESSETSEEQKPKPDALDDLYTSLTSSEMYNNVSVLPKLQENNIKVQNDLVWSLLYQCDQYRSVNMSLSFTFPRVSRKKAAPHLTWSLRLCQTYKKLLKRPHQRYSTYTPAKLVCL